GPSRAATEIEASKAYAKQLMQRAGVPTAAYATFTDLRAAEAYIREGGAPIVVQAPGLAAGKGAAVRHDLGLAPAAARAVRPAAAFGEAGSEVVVEEKMDGEEASVFALTDGADALLLLPSQDHKRVGEGDTGPNTGGMGAYAPASIVTGDTLRRIR